MDTIFRKTPLTDLETDKIKSHGSDSIVKLFFNWKLILFFIPAIFLFFFLNMYLSLIEMLAQSLFAILAFFVLPAVVRFTLYKIEITLGYKKVGKLRILKKIDFFFFKIIVLNRYCPLILLPQDDRFSLINTGQFIVVEKTALHRLISWGATEKIASP